MRNLIIAAMLLVLAVPAMAQDVPAPVDKAEMSAPAPEPAPVVTPAAADSAPVPSEPVKTEFSFMNPELWEILAGIIAVIYVAIKAYLKVKDSKYAKAIEIIETAVRDVYVEFVRSAKVKHADGKLTNDEIKQALKDAWGKAVEIGKNQGVDIAKYVTQEYFPVIVDKIIKLLKKD